MSQSLQIRQFDNGRLPLQQTEGAAAYDLYAREATLVRSGASEVVLCGFAIALPPGWVALICSRSGLAMRHRVFVLNAPGVIDSDYRGEVGALLFNAGDADHKVEVGDRVAQMLIQEYLAPELVVVKDLPSTERMYGGFGSTGR